MEIEAIKGFSAPEWDLNLKIGTTEKVEEPKETAKFVDIFTSAIENVRDTDIEKNELEYLLSVGELDNPAELTIASTRAQIAVELLVQLRNKALEVHSEISKMTV